MNNTFPRRSRESIHVSYHEFADTDNLSHPRGYKQAQMAERTLSPEVFQAATVHLEGHTITGTSK